MNDDDFHPPLCYEEFLKTFNLTEWPARITSEAAMSLNEELGDFQSLDYIIQWMLKEADFSIDPLDSLLERIDKFEEDLRPYSTKVLKDEIVEKGTRLEDLPRMPVEDENKDIKDLVLINSDLVKSRRKASISQTEEEIVKMKLKSVDFMKFPGFRENDFTDLPGSIEAPQILHRIRKAVPVKSGFKKIFTNILLSAASVGFLMDAFWWIFVDMFESDNEEARRLLFNRLSDSYASLFVSVSPEDMDKFFQHFPEAVSMAIYAIFFEGFSESRKLFGSHFKQRIVNTVNEWCTGIHPLPNSFLTWNVSVLETSDLPVAADAQSAEQLLAQRSAAERVMGAMMSMNDPTEVKLDIDTFKRSVQKLGDIEVSPRTLGMVQKSNASDQTSNPMGRGAALKTMKFHHMGKSPLILHYQAMHGRLPMRHEDMRAGLMRTEIHELPDANAQTYRQYLQQHGNQQKFRKENYLKTVEETDKEVLHLVKQRREINRQIRKLQTELDTTKSGIELKLYLNEKINDL